MKYDNNINSKMIESLDENDGDVVTSGSSTGTQSVGSPMNGGSSICNAAMNESGDSVDEQPLEDSDGGVSDTDCKICKNALDSPRVLTCLHIFCESCLNALLIDKAGDSVRKNCIIQCPECKHPTKVGQLGVASLQPDYTLTNVLDLTSCDLSMLPCTSCKSKEPALSRCNDCAHFLCASCDNAHKYMRCFESHEVIILDELRKRAIEDGDAKEEKLLIHKPLFCPTHTSENLKYYCFSCEEVVCNECLVGDHKGPQHHYDIIAEADKQTRARMENLLLNAKSKVQYCDEAASTLSNSLTELQNQHDVAKDLIDETYKQFKWILEKCRDGAVKELEKLHSERELKIMDLLHEVEKSVENIEYARKFTQRVLKKANGPELLSLKKLIGLQFIALIQATPKADFNVSLEFECHIDRFEQLAQDAFGKFHTESTPLSPKESTPPPTLPGMPPMLASSSVNGNSSQGALTGSVTASSPISLPTSMQSSFDGDMSSLGANYIIPSNVMNAESPTQTTINNPITASTSISSNNVSGNSGGPLNCLTSIAEYNLHQLANLAEGTDITDSIVSSTNPSPSPAPLFTLAELISGDQRAFSNLQALAKYGLNNGNLLTRGPSPGIVDSGLLNDFGNLPPATSPMMGSMSDDIASLTNSMGTSNGRSKATPMQIRCKFGQLGALKGHFNSPHGFCLGVEEEIIVADTNNHRIEVFEKNGTFKFQFGVSGKEEGQLWYPRKVAVMRNSGKFVVCDRGNERSRMQIFTKNGHFIKKIAIRYIDIVAGLAVTNQGHIVAVDSVSPTVFVISEEGELVRWFDCSDYMREPSDIAINGSDFYVCDFKGHCVAVFREDGTFQYRIGQEKITCFPNGIDISDAGDILIGDSHGNRFHVACYSRDGTFQSEFECPYVKVSRCCGLKITSEGYVVTLAKNNHHVLVLNTLYIQ